MINVTIDQLSKMGNVPNRISMGNDLCVIDFRYDPSFDEFNVRTRINQPFMWDNRMYILPVYADEVYSNPQMIQAPGY